MADARAASNERRPSPEALLELAAKESRGKLKVFLGMAPGVGKTFAMLSAARAVKADGVDVLVGVVETHGRSETAALLDGLDVLPRKPVDYRRRVLMEFDIEAAIARRPKLLLVDEFAHTNAPGLLHVKRYQDVEEALRNGIDVWTTLNVQHLESLQDVVQRITGIRVKETIPDAVLEKADEIVVIDLPPEELIQRLKEGKVYLPENARRAVDRFFKASNLTALRELALRRTADQVDEQMLAQLRQQGIEGPWPTAERILVCVGDDVGSEAVIRTASRLATAQKADLVALHLRRKDREVAEPKTLRQIERLLKLAERLGAETVRLAADDLTSEILAYARRNNITQIVVGRSSPSLVDRIRGRFLSRDLVDRARGLSILVVAPEESPARPRSLLRMPPTDRITTAVVAALAAVAGAVLIGIGLEQVTQLPNLSMVFLLAVLVCAMRFGLPSALTASMVSFLAYNFFFIDPRYTFTVAEPYELFSLLIFLAVAFVTGTLAGRLSEQATVTRERATATQTLFDFSRKLSGAAKLDDVIWLLTNQAAFIVRGKSVLLIEGEKGLEIVGAWPPEDQIGTSDWAAARWAHEKQEAAGRGTGTLPTAMYQFRPILGSRRSLGVIGIELPDREESPPEQVLATLLTFIEQAAVAIERIQLVEQAARAESASESEQLRSALLSSLSHDLRTPLAAIVGAATGLRTLGEGMSVSERNDLLATIEEEAARLARFVGNLLDMTRLEAGAVKVRQDRIDIADVCTAAADRARRAFPDRTIEVTSDDALPAIMGDAVLLEQAVFNLLDNAHKYSPAGTATSLKARRSSAGIAVEVTDNGVGIPAHSVQRVFEKFYRVADSDGRAAGTGLGLSISAAIVKAHGGTIRAESPVSQGRGTRIVVELPLAGFVQAQAEAQHGA